MAPSFDLLCAEDNSGIFDEVDDNYYGVVVDDDVFQICNLQQQEHQHENLRNLDNININHHHHLSYNNNNNQEHNFEAFFSGFFVANRECLDSMFDNERQHFLGLDYLKRLRNGDLDLGARNLVVDWIHKVGFSPFFSPIFSSFIGFFNFIFRYSIIKNHRTLNF